MWLTAKNDHSEAVSVYDEVVLLISRSVLFSL